MKIVLAIMMAAILSSNVIAQTSISTKIASFSGWLGYTTVSEDLPVSITSNGNNYKVFTLLNSDFTPNRVFIMPEMEETVHLSGTKLMVATQNLFNDDDKLEFISTKNDVEGQIMVVVNEEGIELGEIPYVMSTPQYDYDIPQRIYATNVMEYGGKTYLYLVNQDQVSFYSITKATSGVPAVFSKSASMSVYPNPAKYGETIRFNLQDREINKLEIYDINGNHMIEVGGQPKVEVEASKLQQGINIFRALDMNNNEYVGKVIVH